MNLSFIVCTNRLASPTTPARMRRERDDHPAGAGWNRLRIGRVFLRKAFFMLPASDSVSSFLARRRATKLRTLEWMTITATDMAVTFSVDITAWLVKSRLNRPHRFIQLLITAISINRPPNIAASVINTAFIQRCIISVNLGTTTFSISVAI